jgi:predicted nucleotidyltransferase
VILFGSLARGQVGEDSDIDLLVVMDSDVPFLKRSQCLYEALQPTVALDLLVYTPTEWDRLRDERQTLRRADSEGQVLYETTA